MDEDIIMETFLLAIRNYQPGIDVAGVRAGEAVRSWAGQALGE